MLYVIYKVAYSRASITKRYVIGKRHVIGKKVRIMSHNIEIAFFLDGKMLFPASFFMRSAFLKVFHPITLREIFYIRRISYVDDISCVAIHRLKRRCCTMPFISSPKHYTISTRLNKSISNHYPANQRTPGRTDIRSLTTWRS